MPSEPTPGRWSSAAARSARPPRCCWPAGACRSSSSTAAPARPGRQQGDLPAARRARRLGLRRRRRRDRPPGRHLDHRPHLPPRPELFSFAFADRGRSPFPPFVNVSQCLTEELLDDAIAAQPLIDVRWGHAVTGSSRTTTASPSRCADGGEHPRQPRRRLRRPPRRRHRRALGLTFDGQTFGDQFLICDIRTDLPGWETERRFYFDPEWNPGRQVLIHPCPDSTFRIDWQVPPDFDLAAEEASGGLDARSARSSATGPTRSSGSRSTASTPGSSTGCGSAGYWSPATPPTWSPPSVPAG